MATTPCPALRMLSWAHREGPLWAATVAVADWPEQRLALARQDRRWLAVDVFAGTNVVGKVVFADGPAGAAAWSRFSPVHAELFLVEAMSAALGDRLQGSGSAWGHQQGDAQPAPTMPGTSGQAPGEN